MFKFLKKLFTKDSSPTASLQNEDVSSQEAMQAEGFIDKFEATPAQEDSTSNEVAPSTDESVESEKKTVAPKKKATATKAKAIKTTASKKKTAATKDETPTVKKTAAATKKKAPAAKTETAAAKKKTAAATKKETAAVKGETSTTKKKAVTAKKAVTKATPTTKKKASPAKADISADETKKSVKLQKLPIKKGQILESKRQSKKYSVLVTPQVAGGSEYNEAKKIDVFVLAGSKKEALETLSGAFSGEEPSYDSSNLNLASIGTWDNGNRFLFEITGFEKNT